MTSDKLKALKYFLLSVFFSIFSSCSKENAGLGGEVILKLFPEHHAKAITSQNNYPDTAFLKFNTKEFPGDGADLYDAFFIGLSGESFVRTAGLKKGQYFIYMTGWDTTINQRVAGGIPYKIDVSTGELIAKIPVTESH